MGGSNPISATVRGLGTSLRDLGDNPEKIALGGVFSPLVNFAGANQKAAEKAKAKAEGDANAANAANARAAEDKLIAEESVRAQKEKARKQTVFGGATGANLFNKSLIGASTTAAGGDKKAMLGG